MAEGELHHLCTKSKFFSFFVDVFVSHNTTYQKKVLNPELVKGPWTAEEDAKVIDLVNTHGAKKWSLISSCLPGRIGKQCRERC
jgi:hypothetical protein